MRVRLREMLSDDPRPFYQPTFCMTVQANESDLGPRPPTPRWRSSSSRSGIGGLIQVYLDDRGREAYRLAENGVRVGKTLSMVEGEEAETVLEAVLRKVGRRRRN